MLSIGTLISSIAEWITKTTGSPEGVSVWLSMLLIAVAGGLITTAVMALGWRYKALIVRNRQVRFARILVPYIPKIGFLSALRIPMPRFRFNLSGWRGLATSTGIVGVGFAVALTTVIASTDTTPVWPGAGASYKLPSTFGVPLEPDVETPEEASQTLQLNLGDASRIDKLSFENMSLGKAGLTKCIDITYATTAVATSAYLTTGKLSLTNVSSPTFVTTGSQISSLNIAGKVDGHTYGPTQSSTISDITVNSDRGAGTFTAKDSKVDRIVISLSGTTGPIVGEVEFKNVHCSVGQISISNVKAGEFTQDATSMFGDGTGINSASYVISPSVSIMSGVSNLVDTPITVK
tara:strand:+ start:2438 stop:3484 length:1047 start_codon:yes stop_codon:yes gene_type:complete